MVIEVPREKGDVDVARLTNRLSVVHAFENGEQTRMLLDAAGQRVQVPGTRMSVERSPRGQRCPGGGDCRVDVSLRALGDPSEDLAIRGIDDVERLARLGPLAVDEVAEYALEFAEPVARRLIRFGRRPVFHRFEDLSDGRHVSS